MPKGEHNRKLSDDDIQEIVRLYTTPQDDGTWLGVTTIARMFGVRPNAIDSHFRRLGIPKRTQKQARANGKACKPVTRLPPEGATPPPCKCGCGTPVRWRRSKNSWDVYAPGHYHPHRPHKDRDWLYREYVEKQRSAVDIAKECGVGWSTIYKFLRKYGIDTRSQPETLRLNGKVRGPNNPAWKGGVAPERQRLYKQGKWQQFAQSIYERDGFTCQRCGAPKTTPKSLHAHHIKPWADHPELRFDPDNCVTLCSKCHKWVHSLKNVNREYLE